MQCNVLLENNPHPTNESIKYEHGLSLLLRLSQGDLIFDFGQSNGCLENAAFLGLPLDNIVLGILSHGHYDHAGGLTQFIKRFPQTPVYAKKEALKQGYISLKTHGYEPVDIYNCTTESTRAAIQAIPTGCVELIPHLSTISEISQNHEKPKGNNALLFKEGEKTSADIFDHELITVIDEGGELIVLSGCSHNGILNILETVTSYFPDQPIRTVIGGFHLPDFENLKVRETKEELQNIGRALKQYDRATFYSGHCTGKRAMDILSPIMGKQLIPLYSGMQFTA